MDKDTPADCECDNTHEQNGTVCRYCWSKGLRACPACNRPYDPSRIPPPRVPVDIRCACCCQG